jgi:hypothetical protein
MTYPFRSLSICLIIVQALSKKDQKETKIETARLRAARPVPVIARPTVPAHRTRDGFLRSLYVALIQDGFAC